MASQLDIHALVSRVKKSEIAAVQSHWANSQVAQDSISRFDNLSKGWDRLAGEIWPDIEAISYRFKRLTGLCTSIVWSQCLDGLLHEPDGPIKNDLERLEKEAQRDFDRAKKHLKAHRNQRLDDQTLMESIGSMLWTMWIARDA